MQITLRVRPNPEGWRDSDGKPCVVVPMYGLAGLYVGAVVDQEATAKHKKWHFVINTDEVVTLRCTSIAEFAYYRRFLHDGNLVAADEATARQAGVGWTGEAKAPAPPPAPPAAIAEDDTEPDNGDE